MTNFCKMGLNPENAFVLCCELRTHGSRGVAAAIESGVGVLPGPTSVRPWDSGISHHEKREQCSNAEQRKRKGSHCSTQTERERGFGCGKSGLGLVWGE